MQVGIVGAFEGEAAPLVFVEDGNARVFFEKSILCTVRTIYSECDGVAVEDGGRAEKQPKHLH